MRKILLSASAALVGLLAVACGSGSTGTAVNSCDGAKHKVYLVVEHLDGTSLQKCIGFSSDKISGLDVLKDSGLKYESQTDPKYGAEICSVDSEPKSFDKCLSTGASWLYWTAGKDGTWQAAQVGISELTFADGEALGFRYEVYPASGNPAEPPAPKRS